MSASIRSSLEHLRALHTPHAAEVIDDCCPTCDGQYLMACETYQIAAEVLDDLDRARACWLTPCMRSWHPLRLEQAQKHCAEHGCGDPVLGRFIPDAPTGA